MAPRHVTARGQPIDMGRLRDANAHKPALGNANRNARGDIIDKKGTVLKTQEQITAEWAAAKRQRENSTKQANIKSDTLLADVGASPIVPVVPVKQIDVADQSFDPMPDAPVQTEVVKPTSSRRKITETDS